MDVIITVDTEADNQWETPSVLTLENLKHIPRFQALCDRYGMRPTYLCTYEVARAPEMESLLARYEDDGRAEVGSHLHPWSGPPFSAAASGGLDPEWYPAFPSELPTGLLYDKLAALTEAILRRTGRRPRTYRAGRWGFHAGHIPLLEELGYRVDCSVTPWVSWRHTRGRYGPGVNYRHAPIQPYFLNEADVCRPGASRLLELPMTIVHPSPLMRWSRRVRHWYWRNPRTLPARVLNRALDFQPRWFRPYPWLSAEQLLEVCHLAAARGDGYCQMMLHSSELLPGGSPYNPDAAAIERLYATLEHVFVQLTQPGYRGATLSEVAERFQSHKAPAPVCRMPAGLVVSGKG